MIQLTIYQKNAWSSDTRTYDVRILESNRDSNWWWCITLHMSESYHGTIIHMNTRTIILWTRAIQNCIFIRSAIRHCPKQLLAEWNVLWLKRLCIVWNLKRERNLRLKWKVDKTNLILSCLDICGAGWWEVPIRIQAVMCNVHRPSRSLHDVDESQKVLMKTHERSLWRLTEGPYEDSQKFFIKTGADESVNLVNSA